MMPGLGLNTVWGDWDGGDLSSGRRWEANMRTWIEVRLDMEEEKRESWSPNGVGMLIMRPGWGEMGPGFSWDAQLETWLGWHETRLRNYWGELDGGDTKHGWWWYKILGTWIRGHRTWVDMHCKTWNLDVFEMVPGWIWDSIFGTYLEVRGELYGYQMQIYVPFVMWNTIWMERTHESGVLDWGHFQISRPVWVWDGTWIEFRCTSRDIHQVRCD